MSESSSSTEERPATLIGLDTWDDQAILQALVAGQQRAITAVERALPTIGRAARGVAGRLAGGGRLIYAGAGTSIRVAVQDGSELPATFGMNERKLVYLIAGGRNAMFETMADAEDDAAAGRQAVEDAGCGPLDALIAVAASGATPYTVGAAARARDLGALVVGVANNPGSPLLAACDVPILLETGPEAVAGSTRLGAGTAQKATLNLISTLVHIRLGAVHDGLMVNVAASNAKLKYRAIGIVAKIADVDRNKAITALDAAGGSVKLAVLLCAGAASLDEAGGLLVAAKGNLRAALAGLATR